MKKVPLSLLEKLLIMLSGLGIIGMFGYMVYMYPLLPETIPVHFNASGEADGFGSKGNLFILPCITAAIFVGTMIISRFPHMFNHPVKVTEENKERLYKNGRLMLHVMNVEIVLIFGYLVFSTIEIVQGNQESLGAHFLWIFLGLIGGSIAFFIIRSFRLK
ncbi:DUF1648 domain-containing protein [Priestia taiwanensis]|uniref:DUF1648 domain-containing protein n=1 Tax=Priestia taiwanensis TaxID=1347902 RepID=A0A917EQX6_9BACI|nr:DUF1648 domain-containing protein [Priestia taiwanensis]MBM7363136.1 putative membrane protein [Priestia taiwanensis]GGE67987.1 hypothetical protein GCM10007140_17560 [Priestia taiwanensis]